MLRFSLEVNSSLSVTVNREKMSKVFDFYTETDIQLEGETRTKVIVSKYVQDVKIYVVVVHSTPDILNALRQKYHKDVEINEGVQIHEKANFVGIYRTM